MSPDGAQIAFDSSRNGNNDIFVVAPLACSPTGRRRRRACRDALQHVGAQVVFPPTANARPYAAQETGTVAPDRNRFLEGQLTGQVVDSPEQAINVWDMEMTTHANNLPEHWAFLRLKRIT